MNIEQNSNSFKVKYNEIDPETDQVTHTEMSILKEDPDCDSKVRALITEKSADYNEITKRNAIRNYENLIQSQETA
jgi:hypothetical protein